MKSAISADNRRGSLAIHASTSGRGEVNYPYTILMPPLSRQMF